MTFNSKLYNVIWTSYGNKFTLDEEDKDITVMSIDELRAEIKNIETKVREARRELAVEITSHTDEICKILGKSSKTSKYLQKINIPLISSELRNKMCDRIRILQEKEKKENEQKKLAVEEEYITRAINYCLEHGKKLGEDFHPSYAVAIAKDIAVDLAIAKRIAEGGFISFNGEDNCEGCAGWDMESRRCECGNRRVGWSHQGTFEDLCLFAEAY